MPKEPIKNQAYDLLYRKIMTCDYMPGRFLTEKDPSSVVVLGKFRRFHFPSLFTSLL